MVATGWLSMGAEDIYLMGLFNMGRDSSGAGHYSFGWLGGEPDSSVRGGYTTTNQLDDNLHVGIGDGLEWVALDVIDGLENLVVGVVYDDGGQHTRQQTSWIIIFMLVALQDGAEISGHGLLDGNVPVR